MLFFAIKELNVKILLAVDIETVRSLCCVNKHANEICKDFNFWKEKFRIDNVKLQKIRFSKPSSYISTYKHNMKIQNYITYVLETKSLRISFKNLDIFRKYIKDEDLEKCYIELQKFLVEYERNSKRQDGESYPLKLVYIRRIKDSTEYNIIFSFNHSLIHIGETFPVMVIIDILYKLISEYNFVYDNIPIKIIPFK
jgi:hypothetical protein